ncbi:MAG: histidine kinase N-terminal 7TM domain-containing protein [Nitrospiraceae bacterium]
MLDSYPLSIALYALSNLASSVIFIVLAVFVLLKGQHQQTNRLFALWCISVSIWALGVSKQTLAGDTESALLWSRILHASAAIIPALFLHFILSHLHKDKPFLMAAVYGVAAVFLLAAIYPSEFLIREVSPISMFAFYPKAGPAYPFFLLFFSACITSGFYSLWNARRTAAVSQRNQLRYLLVGTILGFAGGSTAYLHVFGIDIFPYGNYGLVALCGTIIAYAIVRHRLMDITVVIHKGVAYGFLFAAVLIPTYLAVAASQRVTLYSAPPLFAGTLIFACGLWVFLKNPRALTNVTFSLICAGASIWLFSCFLSYSSADAVEAGVWGASAYIGIVYIPAFFYHFCASLLHRRFNNRLIVSTYLVSTIFLLLVPTPYLLNGQHHYFWGYYPKASILHPIFLLYFGSIGAFSLHQLYRSYQVADASSPLEAARLKYLFWGFLIGYLSSLDFAQHYGYEFYPVGYGLASLFTLVMTYAIVKYQLMDGELLPTKPRVLPYLQALGLIPVYAVVLLLIRLFTGSTHYLLAGILLATFLAFAGVLAGLQKRIEKTIERVLFRQRYDAYETLIEFSKAMVTILDLNALNSTIMTTLSKVLGIERMSVFLLDKEKFQFYLASAHGIDRQDIQTLKFASSDMLPHYLSETRSIVVLEELRHILHSSALRPVVETLNLLDAEVCLPLINKDKLIGFFNLGPRASRSSYSEAEINLLTTLAQNAAVALDNAILYEDLRRSQILMRRTDRLRSLETIAGGFAHEIRNPLTSIKTFVQLAPERKHDEEFIGQFSHVVLDDVYRIERLIQEILDYARYMEPKFAEEDLNDVIASCLYFVEVKAESKGILIEKSLASDLPRVMVDRQQLKQVLLNLLLNALEAMGDLGGRLLVRTRRLAKPGDGWMQIEVRDTGPGIAPADLDHIFDPFYTTKHQSDEREGTGLGLTIVHQIVQEHHGYIEVESQLGSGTTFFINLPMVQPLVAFAK